MAGRFSVEAVFKAIDRVTAPVSRMQNRVGKFTRVAHRDFKRLSRGTDQFAAGLKKTAMAATAAALIITAGFTNVVAAGAGFEQAITNVGAVSLKTRAEIAPLEQMALQLGKTTKFTATEAANAMEILSRAGFKSNEILEATPAILSAAAASGLEIAEVADHVSNALKGMGLETSEAARVSDVLALASSRTNSTIGTLGESIRNVASTARQLNIPFEEVAASVALLQDVGLDASVAGSAFNTMLTKMAAPTVGMQKKMRRLGISFKDAKGNMLPFGQVIGQLNKASKKMGGNFDQVAFLAELVGLRGQKAAANLGMLFETGKLEELTKDLGKAKGKAEEMAKLRMNTFQGSMLLLASAVDAVKVKIFGLNSGPLKDVVDRMTKWVSVNGDLIATNIGGFLTMIIANLGNIVKWAERVGIALAVFITFVTVLKTLALIIAVVNGLMLLNPVGLIVVGIAALIAALVAVIFWWDEIKAGLLGVLDTTTGFWWDQILSAAGLVMAAWEPVKLFFVNLWEGVSAGFDTLKGIASGVKSFFGFGDDSEEGAAAGTAAQVVTPQERVARSIEERRSTSTAEVTIKDESGRAEVTGGTLGGGLKLQSTGAF